MEVTLHTLETHERTIYYVYGKEDMQGSQRERHEQRHLLYPDIKIAQANGLGKDVVKMETNEKRWKM